MKKLGLVLAVLAAIALVYTPVMAADKAAAPAAPAAVKTEKAAAPAKTDKAAEKPAVKAKAKKEPVTVTGMVVEIKGKKDKVIGVAIQTDTDTIQVVKKAKEADVAKLVGKKIEAKGFISEKKIKKGTVKKYIRVVECKETI